MSDNSENDFLELLVSLKKKIGMPLLRTKIEELDLLYCTQDEEEIKSKVIDEVSLVVGIDKAYLLDNSLRSRDDKKQMSINYICTLLKDKFGFDLKKIKVIFKIHESNVSRRICMVRSMSPENKVDAKFTKEYNTILENLIKKKVLLIK